LMPDRSWGWIDVHHAGTISRSASPSSFALRAASVEFSMCERMRRRAAAQCNHCQREETRAYPLQSRNSLPLEWRRARSTRPHRAPRTTPQNRPDHCASGPRSAWKTLKRNPAIGRLVQHRAPDSCDHDPAPIGPFTQQSIERGKEQQKRDQHAMALRRQARNKLCHAAQATACEAQPGEMLLSGGYWLMDSPSCISSNRSQRPARPRS